ncbi:hypothetical protein [Roseovarius sp. MMSF_3281]|uniref:hypothetical protein n=1 Tax=Roseovarius sp. MMSF_3281 TaxID=3046694 RepID=UPI00273E0A10|nr:hypothetical protein [Roseovarius sp. MMSF_3281]
MRAFLVTLWAALALCSTAQAQTADALTCDGTDIGQCQAISAYYYYAIPPFPKDPERGDRIIATALAEGQSNCRAGDFAQCFKWVNLVQKQAQTSNAANPAEATLLLLQTTGQACTEGNPDGCYWQAQGLQKMGSARPEKPTYQALMTQAKSLAKAEAETLRPTCKAGDAKACGRLGLLIEDYNLREVTPYERLDFLTQGCVAEYDDACFFLGFAVTGLAQTEPSQPVEAPIKAETIANLQNLCDAGHGRICTLLATRILNPKDAQAFLSIAEKACDAGDAIGCSAYGMTQLGEYRETPKPETLAKATEALTKACDQDFTLSCHALEHLSQQ